MGSISTGTQIAEGKDNAFIPLPCRSFLRKNPFVFKMTDVVVNDTVLRVALTEEHLGIWMNFIEKDNTYCKYYDEFVVLLKLA